MVVEDPEALEEDLLLFSSSSRGDRRRSPKELSSSWRERDVRAGERLLAARHRERGRGKGLSLGMHIGFKCHIVFNTGHLVQQVVPDATLTTRHTDQSVSSRDPM